MKRSKNNEKERVKLGSTVICKHCSAEFVKMYPTHYYCSDECRKEVEKEQRRERSKRHRERRKELNLERRKKFLEMQKQQKRQKREMEKQKQLEMEMQKQEMQKQDVVLDATVDTVDTVELDDAVENGL